MFTYNWFDLFTYLLVITITLLVVYYKNYLKSVYIAFKLPGPPKAIPFIGHALLIKDSQKLQEIGNEMSLKYGPIMKVWLGFVPFFFITEPKHLQILLATNKYSTKNMFYTFLHNFIGEGLITNSGNKWKLHRKLMQPYFHVNLLKCFFDSFHACSLSLIGSLENNFSDNEATDVNVALLSNEFVLNVLNATVLGIPERTINNDDPDTPFRKGKLFVPYRISRPWLLFDWIFKWTQVAQSENQQKEVLHDYTRKILEERRNKTRKTCEEISNFMEMMMEISKNNPEFTEKDVINETSTLMLAGQDSVGAALAFTLYHFAKHPEIQEKAVQELNLLFENTQRGETFEDLASMKYLEQCIKETLRLCPPVPIVSRKLIQETCFGEKLVFPEGTNVFISPFVTHRMPHIFPDPLKFDPERFSAEKSAGIHPFAFIPFSAGPRNCIGYKFALLEIKTVLSKILRKYDLSLVPGREELVLSYRITLRAKGGVWIRLKKRL